MNTSPLVSVLMTAYNRQDYIAEAIMSVLNSNFTEFELIIVDDASTDDTVRIASQFASKDNRIRLYVNDVNLGDYPNRNKAASYATGRYIKYVDSDDILYPYSLDIMLSAMQAFPLVKLGICHFLVQLDEAPYPLLMQPEQAYYFHFLKNGLLFSGPSGAIINREYFNSIGGFSEKRFISDTELWLTIAQKEDVLILPAGLIWWRRHEGQEFNLGHVNGDYIKLAYDLNKKFLESNECPLTQINRDIAFRNFKNRYGRTILTKVFGLKISEAIAMKNAPGYHTSDLLRSLIPINTIKRVVSKLK